MNTQASPGLRAARPQLVINHLKIAMSGLQPGARLPSETALSQELGVSRNTVRDALASLERDGAVVRRHGLGTFKAAPKPHLQAPLNRVLPIPEVIRASGYEPSVEGWTYRLEPADVETCRDLGLSEDTPVFLIELLYRANGLPAVQVTYAISPKIYGAQSDWSAFDPVQGVVSFLREHFPDRLDHTSTRIAAVSADDHIAALLQLQPGDPLLRFTTLGIAATGEVLYRNVSYQSGDLLDVHILRPVNP